MGVFPLVFCVDATSDNQTNEDNSQDSQQQSSSSRSQFDRFLDAMAASLMDDPDDLMSHSEDHLSTPKAQKDMMSRFRGDEDDDSEAEDDILLGNVTPSGGGMMGMGIAFVIAGGMNLFSYWNADKIVLRMQGARQVDETERSPILRTFVQDTKALAQAAGMPEPKIYIIDTQQPNAFATGRNPQNAAVAATTGLLNPKSKKNASLL